MAVDFYTQGFLSKIAAYEKAAAYADTIKDIKAIRKDEDRATGIVEPDPYVKPTTFKGTLAHKWDRGLTHLSSLGRGIASAGGNLLMRAGQGAADFYTFIPRMADQLLMGKLLGVDEGRGMFGRMYGNFDRLIDKKVHGLREWSNKYDEKHRIKGGFNRFLNGVAADAAGTFIGWRGLHRGLFNKAMAGFGAYGTLSPTSSQGQLRQREAWIRSLDPIDRLRVDPTSTAHNQENAPTAAEYQRYHMPSYGLPTSSTGMIRVPYNWMHQSNYSPVNFRDFGT